MPNAGKVVAVYAVVCDEDVWREINPNTLADNFDRELRNIGFTATGGPPAVKNSLCFTFRIYGRISWDNVYEVVIHAWGEIPNFINNQAFTACFIRAWNACLWEPSTGEYRASVFPFSVPLRGITPFSTTITATEVTQDAINIVNSGRIFRWIDYSEIRGTVENYSGLPPMSLSDSWIDRLTTSNILGSNDRNFINRSPSIANLSQTLISAARNVGNELAPAASAAANAASEAASDIGSRAAAAAESAVGTVIDRVRQNSPFSSNEIQLGVNLLIVFGILGAGTYIIGKVSK